MHTKMANILLLEKNEYTVNGLDTSGYNIYEYNNQTCYSVYLA
jgi:hypothetical protein